MFPYLLQKREAAVQGREIRAAYAARHCIYKEYLIYGTNC